MPINKITFLSVALIAAFLSSTAAADRLPGSEWALKEINAAAVTAGPEVFLRFEQSGMFFGNGGCNNIRGQFVTNEGAILFGPAATTMMACPDPVSKREFEFIQTLNTVRGFERDGDRLVLSNAEGVVVLRLMQRDVD